VAGRERFFEFNWVYFIGLVAFAIGGWVAEGPWLVLGSLAVAALIAAGWYPFWRRKQRRRNQGFR
jgi:membrane protein implicated in regulation of membrane protease activity